jgi:hypothetical protein
MKRSLVFYRGKAPSGKKTDWVMHEYRLAGGGLAPCRRAQGSDAAGAQPSEDWVLCRVFRKRKGAATAAAADRTATTDSAQDPIDDSKSKSSGVRFIDFFARADALRRPRAVSPLSSSCVTDGSAGHCREQESTSNGARAADVVH